MIRLIYIFVGLEITSHKLKTDNNQNTMIQKKLETEICILQFEELNSSQQSLILQAKMQVQNAYAPYSKFQVGAAVKLENGEIFTGNNQENAAYPSGLCAERVALFYANAQFPTIAVNTIAIAAYTNGEFLEAPISPCGGCRQVLLESEIRFDQNIELLLYGTKYIYRLKNTKQLLPLSFDRSALELL